MKKVLIDSIGCEGRRHWYVSVDSEDKPTELVTEGRFDACSLVFAACVDAGYHPMEWVSGIDQWSEIRSVHEYLHRLAERHNIPVAHRSFPTKETAKKKPVRNTSSRRPQKIGELLRYYKADQSGFQNAVFTTDYACEPGHVRAAVLGVYGTAQSADFVCLPLYDHDAAPYSIERLEWPPVDKTQEQHKDTHPDNIQPITNWFVTALE